VTPRSSASSIAASTLFGLYLTLLIISISLDRPTKLRYPDTSMKARSPVLNYPLLAKGSAVAVGLLNYSLNTIWLISSRSPISQSRKEEIGCKSSEHAMIVYKVNKLERIRNNICVVYISLISP
jgi:hypothetical protein